MAKKTLQGIVMLFGELVVLYVIMLLVSSCGPAVKDQWPYPMTSFFAECEYEGKVFVDREYIKRKTAGGCKNGKEFKYYDRGKPTLTND